MCFLRAKPIGVMQMLDQGEQDDKVGRGLADKLNRAVGAAGGRAWAVVAPLGPACLVQLPLAGRMVAGGGAE
jgi:hypothetical protein